MIKFLPRSWFSRVCIAIRWSSTGAETTQIAPKSKLEHFVSSSVAQIVTDTQALPTSYTAHLSQIINMINSHEYGQLPQKSHPPLIDLCEKVIDSLPKLSSTSILRATQNLHQLSHYIGFSLSTAHIEKYFSLFSKKIPREIEEVFPIFTKLLISLCDPETLKAVRSRINEFLEEYVENNITKLKAKDIATVFEVFTQTEYKNDKVVTRLFKHMIKHEKSLQLAPYDVYTLWLFESLQNKEHPEERIEFLLKKAKEIIPDSSPFILTNMLAFRKVLNIDDEDFLQAILNRLLESDVTKLYPLAYSTLLNLMGEPEIMRKGKALLKCLVELFMDPKEQLADPRYWDSMSVFLFLGGIETAKIFDLKFTTKAEAVLQKALENLSRKELIVPIGRRILRGRFSNSKTIISSYHISCKRMEKELDQPAKESLRELFGEHPLFADFNFE